MNKLALVTAMILVVGTLAVIGTQTEQINAKTQPLKSLQCDTAKNCKVIFVNPKGDIELQITNTANASGGGGGGGTVDQVARDGVTALENNDNAQNARLQNVEQNDTIQNNNIGSVQAADEALNNNVTSLQVQVDELRGQIQNLTTQLENVIIDVNVDNQTTGGGNDTGVVIPPINETGGGVENQTGGGNETGNVTG